MFRLLSILFLACSAVKEAACLMRNIKPSNGHLLNANATIVPRDLFARQSCDPGYGICDTGSCCPLDDQCCGYGCAPGDSVCCGDSGNCPGGSTCCDYDCAPSGWGCCDTGYAAPLDGDCCGDGGYCPSGTYCVDCDDGIEGCCNAPYSVSSYYYGTSSYYIPEPSSIPYPSPSYSDNNGGVSSSYSYGGGGIGNYQYYYTWFTYWYLVYYRTTETLTSTTTTTSTRLSVYASNSYAAQSQFKSLENYVSSLYSSPVTMSTPPFPSASAPTPTGGVGPGSSARGIFARGDILGLWMFLFAGLTGWLAVAL